MITFLPVTGNSAYRFDGRWRIEPKSAPAGENTISRRFYNKHRECAGLLWARHQEQIHVHGENGGGIQYRVNDVFLPKTRDNRAMAKSSALVSCG